MLGELSAFLRYAEDVERSLKGEPTQSDLEGDCLDQLLLNAFKTVLRAAKFLDIWSEEAALASTTANSNAQGAGLVPPTPPADVTSFDTVTEPVTPVETEMSAALTPTPAMKSPELVAGAFGQAATPTPALDGIEAAADATTPTGNQPTENAASKTHASTEHTHSFAQPGLSAASDLPAPQFPLRSASLMHRPTRPASVQTTRHSQTYRISMTAARGPLSPHAHSASNQLTRTHERLNENLINFEAIASRASNPSDILLATGETLHGGREMLAVVDEIWERHQPTPSPKHIELEHVRDLMYRQLHTLVLDASYVFDDHAGAASEDERMSPASLQKVADSAAACIRTAHECRSVSRSVLERSGDFEVPESVASTPFEDAREFPESQQEQVEDGDGDLLDSAEPLDVSEFPMPGIGKAVLPKAPLPPPEDDTESLGAPTPPAKDEADPIDVSEFPIPGTGAPALPPLDTGVSSLGDFASPMSASTVTTQDSGSQRHSINSMPTAALSPHTPLSILATPVTPAVECGNLLVATEVDRTTTGNLHVESMHPQATNLVELAKSALIVETQHVSTPSTDSFTTSIRDSTRSVTTMDSSSGFHTSPKSSLDGRLPLDAAEDVTTKSNYDLEIESTIQTKTYAHELLLGRDGQISGGSLPALVERLTTNDCTPDALFVTSFFLTFRIFTTPNELAATLIDRFEYIEGNNASAVPVRLRVYNVFKQWLQSHWRADCDKSALAIIVPFAQTQLISALPTAGQRLLELTTKVATSHSTLVPRQVAAIGRTNTSNAQYQPAETTVPAANFSKTEASLLTAWKKGGASPRVADFTPLEMARQLTIKASGIFCSILPEELLQREWTKSEGSIAFNVRAMTTLSNDLISWITETILLPPDPKKRAKMLKHWIKIGVHCLELNNLFVALQITAALSNSTVHRLTKAWEYLSAKNKDRLAQLNKLFDPQRNKAAYRARLNGSVGPCVPFLGIHQTDLFHIDDHNKNYRSLSTDAVAASPRPIINLEKHTKTAKIISELQRFQVPYQLEEVADLQTWIQDQLITVRTHDETTFLTKQQAHYRRSCLLEPREQARTDAHGIPLPPVAAPKEEGEGRRGWNMPVLTRSASHFA